MPCPKCGGYFDMRDLAQVYRLGCRRAIAERGMRSQRIVVRSPLLDKHLGLVQRRELLTRQQLGAELGVETLAVAVIPRAERLDADPVEPLAHVTSNELGLVVRTNVLRCPVCNEAVTHVVGPALARHDDSQAAPCESSITVSMRRRLPSSLRSCMKSYDQT